MLRAHTDMKKGSWPQTVGKVESYSFPQNQQKTSRSISYACTLESLLPVHLLCIIWAPKEKNTSHHHITSHYHLQRNKSRLFSLGFFFLHFHSSAWSRSVIDHMMPAIPKLSYASRHALEFKKCCRHAGLLPHEGSLTQWFGWRIP